MEIVLSVATVLVAVVSGLTELVKQLEVIPSRFLPLTSLVIGICTGLLATTLIHESMVVMMWAGGIAGLASCGLYDGLKQNKNTGEDENGKNMD